MTTFKAMFYRPTPEELAQSAIRLGWVATTDKVWQYLAEQRPKVALLAPPLDTIPSPQGNAIYTLVENIAANLDFPALVLARWPATGWPALCPVSDRTLYYTKSLNQHSLQNRLPFRLKKRLWGTSAPYLLNYARAAAKLCGTLNIALLNVQDIPIFCITAKQAQARLRVVLHQHCNAPLSFSTVHWKRAIRASEGIIFVAKAALATTETQHGKIDIPVKIIHNGVDLSHYNPEHWHVEAARIRAQLGIPAEATVLLFIGRIIPGKGPAEAISAFNAAQVRGSHMIVVGALSESLYADAAYSRQVDHAAAAANVHLVGTVAQANLPAYYAAADGVIVPSIAPEGLPKTITEALAMGKPVLASDRGGMWELLQAGRNAWLIPDPKDPHTLTEVIRIALSDHDRLAQMSARILASDRKRMDQRRMSKEFGDFLLEVLARNHILLKL